jgi:RNA polymerase sigma-70 factor (ECF subfamily)
LDHEESTKRFYDLVWPQRATVLRVAQILCGSAADGEDLAQETLLKAFKAIDTFREGTDAKAWLLAILRNARVDRLRARGAIPETVSLGQLDWDAAQPEQVETLLWENPEEILNSFSDAQVISALQRLPEDIRLTLLLVDVEQLRHEEAATILLVPVGTIKSRTHRGRSMLREALRPLARELRLVRE